MFLSGGSATGIAGAVWTNASRTLTGFGGAALSGQSVTLTSLPALGAVDLRPAGSTFALGTVAGNSASAGTLVFRLYDGTNSITLLSIAAATAGTINVVSTSFVGLRINNNDGTNAAQYMYAAIIFHA